MDYTKEIEYYYSGEYAYKSPVVLTEENKSQVELYDRYQDQMVDISEKTVNQLAKTLAEIAANGRKITEEEYNQIVNS